jgi:diguanylate cyclase (GGDEF)-like protein
MKKYPRPQQAQRQKRPDDHIRRVFISYSHDSSEHAEAILGLADKLRRDGIDAFLDQYEQSPPFGWPYWMEEQIRQADFVLIICTESYRYHLEHLDSLDNGRGVLWESNIIYNCLYADHLKNKRFVPILGTNSLPENIPTPLKGFTYFKPETPAGYDAMYRYIVGDPLIKRPPLGPVRVLPKKSEKLVLPRHGLDTEKEIALITSRLKAPLTTDPLLAGVRKDVIALSGSPTSFTADTAMQKSEGHAFLTERLESNIDRWKYSGGTATMIILDVDGLTQINNLFGNRVGDAVLYAVYKVLSHSQADYSGRCGDDTFYAIFIYVPKERTERLAQDLCDSIRTFRWDALATGLRVTASVGVAHFDREEPTIDWPVRAAIGMRQAKEQGGNRVSVGPAMLPLSSGSHRVSRNLSHYYSGN